MKEDSFILNTRSEKKKKFDFGQKKENTIRSLSEVEQFLCQCNKAFKCGKIIKLLKR